MKSILAIFICFLTFNQTQAQENFVGSWKGDIIIPSGKLGVLFHIGQKDGKLTCKMDVPMQGAKDVPAAKIVVADKFLSIVYPALGASYEGEMVEEGKISGTWTQGGIDMNLDLEKYEGEDNALQRPQHPKPPFNYDIEEISVVVGEGDSAHQLSGTLTLPKGEGPFPTAILVSGSGPQDRDETLLGHKPFWVIANYFANNGIATYRYDDRGVGASTGKFADATSMDFKVDALAALKQIAKHEKIDAEKIGIVGHSEGGLICALAAAESLSVKYIVMLAGPGVPGSQILKRQIAEISSAEGSTEEEMERDGSMYAEIIDLATTKLAKAEKIERAKKRFRIYYNNQLSEEERAEMGDFNTYFTSNIEILFSPWMNYFLNVDPKKYIERVRCPTLALIGENDLQVSPTDNIPALEVALNAAPTNEWKVEEIPNVNHLFQVSRSGAPSEYGELIETFNQQVMAMMRDWIKKI